MKIGKIQYRQVRAMEILIKTDQYCVAYSVSEDSAWLRTGLAGGVARDVYRTTHFVYRRAIYNIYEWCHEVVYPSKWTLA
jgi:hypothetical protein